MNNIYIYIYISRRTTLAKNPRWPPASRRIARESCDYIPCFYLYTRFPTTHLGLPRLGFLRKPSSYSCKSSGSLSGTLFQGSRSVLDSFRTSSSDTDARLTHSLSGARERGLTRLAKGRFYVHVWIMAKGLLCFSQEYARNDLKL